eukprot:g17118.t1
MFLKTKVMSALDYVQLHDNGPGRGHWMGPKPVRILAGVGAMFLTLGAMWDKRPGFLHIEKSSDVAAGATDHLQDGRLLEKQARDKAGAHTGKNKTEDDGEDTAHKWFYPPRGLESVLIRPGVVSPLQLTSTRQDIDDIRAQLRSPQLGQAIKERMFASCLFCYGNFLEKLPKGYTDLPRGAQVSEGRVYGARLQNGGNLAYLTQQTADALPGTILCWPFLEFKTKLQRVDRLRSYDPDHPKRGSTRRELVDVVLKDGSVVKAEFHYLNHLPASENALSEVDVDVLVVGAGPTGLTAAAEARRHGLSVRLIDSALSRSTQPKARILHARSLEALEALEDAQELSHKLVKAGRIITNMNVLLKDKKADPRNAQFHRIALEDLDWGDTRYPFWLAISQTALERILETHLLEKRKLAVEYGTSLVSFTQSPLAPLVEAKLSSGELLRAKWLIGCDGPRSTTASLLKSGLVRPALGAMLVLADLKANCRQLRNKNELWVFKGAQGLLILLPFPTYSSSSFNLSSSTSSSSPSRSSPSSDSAPPSFLSSPSTTFHLIAHFPGRESPDPNLTVSCDFLDELVRARTGLILDCQELGWHTQQVLTQGGIRDTWRRQRVFLAGDAAHVTSLFAGQGMNLGIQDSHNLVWKLGLAARLELQDMSAIAQRFLDSYQQEREAVARKLMERAGWIMKGLLYWNSNMLVDKTLVFLGDQLLPRKFIQQSLARQQGMLELTYPSSDILHTDRTGVYAAWPESYFPSGMGRRVPNPAVLQNSKVSSLQPGFRLHDLLQLAGRTGHSLILFANETEKAYQVPLPRCSAVIDPITATPDAYQMFSLLVRALNGFPEANSLWGPMFQTIELSLEPERILRTFFSLVEEYGSVVALIRPDLVVAGVWPMSRLTEVGAPAGMSTSSLTLLSVLLSEGQEEMHGTRPIAKKAKDVLLEEAMTKGGNLPVNKYPKKKASAPKSFW